MQPGVLSALLLAQLHDRPDELRRRQDRRADHRLADLGDARGIRHVRGVVHLQDVAVGHLDLESHRRHRRHQVQVVLALQALAHDVHVQQPEEPAAEAEPERVGGLGLPAERRVVQGQLLERVAQVRVAVGVDREEPAEDHRLDVAVAGQGLGRAAELRRERVADAQLRHVLDARDEVADLAGAQLGRRDLARREEADVVDLGLGAGDHRADSLALAETPSTTRM